MKKQRLHTRTMSKTGTTFEAGGDVERISVKEYHEIQNKIDEALNKDGIETVEVSMSFLNLYDFASIRLKKAKDQVSQSEMINAIGRHFKRFARIEKADGLTSVKLILSKNDARIPALNEWVQNKLVAGQINYNELETLKKLLLDISKMDGYNKQAMLCIYLVAELQNGRRVSQCLTDNLYKIINPASSESLN